MLADMLGQGGNFRGCSRHLHGHVLQLTAVLRVFLAAAVAAYGPLGVARSLAVRCKTKAAGGRRAKVALYSPNERQLQGHCFFAATLRGLGVCNPSLAQVQRLRAATARFWRCRPKSLEVAAEKADMSPWQYAMAIGEDYWGGAPDLLQLAYALQIKAVIRDSEGRVLWSSTRSSQDYLCTRDDVYDVELILHQEHYSTLKQRSWRKSFNREAWALRKLRRFASNAEAEEQLFQRSECATKGRRDKEAEVTSSSRADEALAERESHTEVCGKEETCRGGMKTEGSRSRSRSHDGGHAEHRHWEAHEDLQLTIRGSQMCVLCRDPIAGGHWHSQKHQERLSYWQEMKGEQSWRCLLSCRRDVRMTYGIRNPNMEREWLLDIAAKRGGSTSKQAEDHRGGMLPSSRLQMEIYRRSIRRQMKRLVSRMMPR